MSVVKFNPSAQSERWDSIPRATLQDTSLSSTAFQLLMFLLSQPSSWQVSKAHLQKSFGWGKNKVSTAIKELKDAGYLETVQTREKGRFGGSEFVVHPIKQPNTENRDTVNRDMAERPLENTDKQNTDLEKKTNKKDLFENQIAEFDGFEDAKNQYQFFAKQNKLRVPRTFSEKTKKQTRSVLKTLKASKMTWADYLNIIQNSPFLLGQNKSNWSVTFDWILKPANFEKIINGNYEQQTPKKQAVTKEPDEVDLMLAELSGEPTQAPDFENMKEIN